MASANRRLSGLFCLNAICYMFYACLITCFASNLLIIDSLSVKTSQEGKDLCMWYCFGLSPHLSCGTASARAHLFVWMRECWIVICTSCHCTYYMKLFWKYNLFWKTLPSWIVNSFIIIDENLFCVALEHVQLHLFPQPQMTQVCLSETTMMNWWEDTIACLAWIAKRTIRGCSLTNVDEF